MAICLRPGGNARILSSSSSTLQLMTVQLFSAS